jgi:AmiR/NasT family two-component response regulator
VDEELIAALTAEGVLSRRHAAILEEALRSARIIGAAIGIVMENRDVSEAEAFMSLSKASQDTNRKLRLIADEVVNTRHLSLVPDGL